MFRWLPFVDVVFRLCFVGCRGAFLGFSLVFHWCFGGVSFVFLWLSFVFMCCRLCLICFNLFSLVFVGGFVGFRRAFVSVSLMFRGCFVNVSFVFRVFSFVFAGVS